MDHKFFRLQQFQGEVLNPASTHLAYVREVEGRWNLMIMEGATRRLTNVVGYDNADVVRFAWLDDERLLYEIVDVRPGARVGRRVVAKRSASSASWR